MQNINANIIGVGKITNYKAIATILANNHETRVLADGGVLPDKQNLINFFTEILKTTNDRNAFLINTFCDPHLTGYKIGSSNILCAKIYSIKNNTDLIQSNSLNQPYLNTYDGNPYVFNSNIAGNMLSTPHSSNITFYNNFVFELCIKRTSNSTKEQYIIYKNSYRIMLDTSNHIAIIYNDGTLQGYYFTSYVVPLNTKIYLKCIRDKDNGYVYLKVSTDNINWTTYSKSSTLASLASYSDILSICSRNTDQGLGFFGNIYYIKMYEGLENNAILKVYLNPNDFNYNNINYFTSSNTGEKWTFTRSSTGYQINIIKRTNIETDGITTYISNTYAYSSPRTDYFYTNNDSEINLSIGLNIGIKSSIYKQNFGGVALSFDIIHDSITQQKVKNILNKYTNFFFDINTLGAILNINTILNTSTILI